MPEAEHLHLHNTEKRHVAETISKVIKSAISNAQRSGSLLRIPPDADPAFPLLHLSKSTKSNRIHPEQLLHETFGAHKNGLFSITAGNVIYEITGNIEELQKDNFRCTKIMVRGNSLYLSVEKNGESIAIHKEERMSETEMRSIFLQLAGDEQADYAKDSADEYDAFISDAYAKLANVLVLNTDIQEARVTTGSLMSIQDGDRYMQILETIYESGMPLEKGAGRVEYSVYSNVEYANAHNPKGLYFSHTHTHTYPTVETGDIPVPLVHADGTIIAWTIANFYYESDPHDSTQIQDERIDFIHGADFIQTYETELLPLRELYALERNAVGATTRYIEDLIEDQKPDLDSVKQAFAQLPNEFAQEACSEILGLADFDNDRAFQMLARSIAGTLAYAFPENANETYLLDLESRYLAFKVYNGQQNEEELLERIRNRDSNLNFQSLHEFLRYLISLRGTRMILL